MVFLPFTSTTSPPGNKTLIIVDRIRASVQSTHSRFLAILAAQGLDLEFADASDPQLQLLKEKGGARAYANVVLFAPASTGLGERNLQSSTIAEFIDSGGNVLVAADSNTADFTRDVAANCGFELDEAGTAVIDHKHKVADDSTWIKSVRTANVDAIVGPPLESGVLFRGVGLATDEFNALALELLTAGSTAYSYNPAEQISNYPMVIGKSTVLVGGLEARNHARVVVSGSIEMFSDQFFLMDGAENERFAKSLASWVFGVAARLRVRNVNHALSSGRPQRAEGEYTLGDVINYSVVVEAASRDAHQFEPFDAAGLQLEVLRGSELFARKTLVQFEGGSSCFGGLVALPSSATGVFKLQLRYERPGYTQLRSSTTIVVRPLRQEHYDWFHALGFPYYVSAVSMVVGVVLFSVAFAYSEGMKKTKGVKTA
eukprot:gene2668-33999_t